MQNKGKYLNLKDSIMKTLFAILLVIPSLILAQTPDPKEPLIHGSVPVVCAGLEDFAETMHEFGEVPMLTGLSNRDTGNKVMTPFALVVFANPKTGTFTIVEQVADRYCVISLGENLQPYVQENSYKKSGL